MFLVSLFLAAATPVAPAPKAPTVEDFNLLLDQNDFGGLAKALNASNTPASFQINLDWEQRQMIAGASIFVSLRYATDLWQLAEALKADEVRQTAALALLYAVATQSIDGKRCRDISAPGNRLQQFGPALRPIVLYLKGSPIDVREKLVNLAVTLESRTQDAPSRKADGFLCSGGIEEIQFGLQHGTSKKTPTPPGHIGKTFTVDSAGYKPAFVPEQLSAEKVTAERAKLSQTLRAFAGL